MSLPKLQALIQQRLRNEIGEFEFDIQWRAALSVLEEEIKKHRNQTIIELEKITEAEILKDDDATA